MMNKPLDMRRGRDAVLAEISTRIDALGEQLIEDAAKRMHRDGVDEAQIDGYIEEARRVWADGKPAALATIADLLMTTYPAG